MIDVQGLCLFTREYNHTKYGTKRENQFKCQDLPIPFLNFFWLRTGYRAGAFAPWSNKSSGSTTRSSKAYTGIVKLKPAMAEWENRFFKQKHSKWMCIAELITRVVVQLTHRLPTVRRPPCWFLGHFQARRTWDAWKTGKSQLEKYAFRSKTMDCPVSMWLFTGISRVFVWNLSPLFASDGWLGSRTKRDCPSLTRKVSKWASTEASWLKPIGFSWEAVNYVQFDRENRLSVVG